QAEDGIRDFHVTGVQTCALPISSRACAGSCRWNTGVSCRLSGGQRVKQRLPEALAAPAAQVVRQLIGTIGIAAAYQGFQGFLARSEERRVGKGGRTWTGPWLSEA